MTTAVAHWGEADLIDALREQYGIDLADDMRDVIQTWFDKGNGVAVYVREGTQSMVFEQTLPGVRPAQVQTGYNPSWILVAVIPGSPIPTVQ